MKTKTPVILLTSILLGCVAAPAQDAKPPVPPAGVPPLAPPRGDQPPPPRPQDGAGRPGGGPRDGQDGGREKREHDGPRPPRPDDQRDGQRDGQRHGPGGEGEHRPEAPREPQPFLGVSAAPVPPPLAVQLSLPEGFGLLVLEVLPESSAGKAGLQRFDVLKQLNDQQLVDPAQLSALVRAAGKGKEVSLTVIRKAQEQKVVVTVGEHVPSPAEHRSPGFNPEMFRDHMRALQEKGRELQDHFHGFQEHGRPQPPAPLHSPDGAQPPRQGGGPGEGSPGTTGLLPEELLRAAQPGAGTQIQVYGESSVTTLDSAKARLRLKDREGEIEVAGQDGQRTLTARDPQGTVVFTGPVNTEEERAAVPEGYRNKLAQIRVRPQAEESREVQ